MTDHDDYIETTADDELGDDCFAEFVDGSWDYCGCRDCNEREARDREADLDANDGVDLW